MTISRILGLVGTAGVLGWIGYNIFEHGIPDKPGVWLIVSAALLTAFNFVPVNTTDKDNLFALWLELKKAQIRKQKLTLKKQTDTLRSQTEQI
jgi:hypothetical protein